MKKVRLAICICCGLLAISIFIALPGCTNQSAGAPKTEAEVALEEQKAEETEPKFNPVQAVCILDNLPSWPSFDATADKPTGRLKKGETVLWLGDTQQGQDSAGNQQDYYNIRDVDGNEAWALADWVVPSAKPAAVLSETTIYSKKSLISKTQFIYKSLDIVAVLSEESDWLKVVGTNKAVENWIKPGSLTYDEVDIAVANQALAVTTEKDNAVRQAKLRQILEDIDAGSLFGDSLFISELTNMLETPAGKLVLVKAGSFRMGSDDGSDYQKPAHAVRISRDFFIGKHEITFALYDAFCEETGKTKPDDGGWGRDARPEPT